ncbi:MAG: hypothetical protein GXP55_10090 [Deltaproteobacteria bacterium]|nr:hypothetical protein [Deltaproteobacteria bacterium]
MSSSRVAFFLSLSCLLGLAGAASAQEMAQGEARITARSNVRLGIESGPGTSGRTLGQIGAAAGAALRAIRGCYGEVAERDPTIRGEMRVRLSIGSGRHPVTTEIAEGAPTNRDLTRCVVHAVESADYSGVRPGATAYLVLTFTNTAAEGVERTRERRVTEDSVDVTRDAEGHLSASGGPPDGRLRFSVTAQGDESQAAVSAAQRALRATIPTFLDCRRKAGRRDGSPEGELSADLRVSRRGRARARVRSNTVQNRYGTAQAGRCFGNGLNHAPFTAEAAGRYRVVLTLHERATPSAPAPTAGRNEADPNEG